MKFLALFGASAISLLLAACSGSSYLASVNSTNAPNNSEQLITTLQATSNKIPEIYATCIRTQLQAHYPSSNLIKKAVNLYQGTVPGTDRDHPRAIYDISSTTDEILAVVTLKQVQPVDQQLLDLFNSCM